MPPTKQPIKQPTKPPTKPPARLDRDLFDGALRARKARPTRQRRAIFAALSGRFDHPTAETLHRAVRRRVPGLSLATVYTTLEILVRAGLAGRLIGPDGVARYDARTDGHDHRRCLACGRIDDLDRSETFQWSPSYAAAGFRPTGFRIEVTGYCAGCQDRAGRTRKEPSRTRPPRTEPSSTEPSSTEPFSTEPSVTTPFRSEGENR